MEVGIDVLDIDRMVKLVDKNTFLNKYFTNNEIMYLNTKNGKIKHVVLAGYYSLKEAFLKACGIGIGRGIDLKEIEISYTSLGRPIINLTDKAKKVFNELGYNKISCSITDSKNITVAICLVE